MRKSLTLHRLTKKSLIPIEKLTASSYPHNLLRLNFTELTQSVIVLTWRFCVQQWQATKAGDDAQQPRHGLCASTATWPSCLYPLISADSVRGQTHPPLLIIVCALPWNQESLNTVQRATVRREAQWLALRPSEMHMVKTCDAAGTNHRCQGTWGIGGPCLCRF